MVLGGLIREDLDEGQSGLPGLSQLPGVGVLFGTTSERAERTELVVLITPRAVSSAQEAADITSEFRSRMEALRPFEKAAKKLLEQQRDEDAEKALEEAVEEAEGEVEKVSKELRDASDS